MEKQLLKFILVTIHTLVEVYTKGINIMIYT